MWSYCDCRHAVSLRFKCTGLKSRGAVRPKLRDGPKAGHQLWLYSRPSGCFGRHRGAGVLGCAGVDGFLSFGFDCPLGRGQRGCSSRERAQARGRCRGEHVGLDCQPAGW